VRSQFLSDPVPDLLLGRLLQAAHHGPSVGFMQPWDFIVIRSPEVRRAIHENFIDANRQAAKIYSNGRRELYDGLKLAGIVDAPLNLCVTCDHDRTLGAGLGRQSDPATDLYSTACAVQNLWLAARAEGIGVGWVSILNPERLRALLEIPERITPVAYLCLGYVTDFASRPELETRGWERRESLARLIHFDGWSEQDEQRAASLLSS